MTQKVSSQTALDRPAAMTAWMLPESRQPENLCGCCSFRGKGVAVLFKPLIGRA
jgi:hypothetical protein